MTLRRVIERRVTRPAGVLEVVHKVPDIFLL
jgi:hypothetical protein